VAAIAAVFAALAPAGHAAKLEYGIVPQDGALPGTGDLDMMPGAGITGMRIMIPWGVVEPDQGTYDWSQIDPVIRELIGRGIKPFPFLYGSPEWATEKDGWDCSGAACAVYPPRSDETKNAFAAFAAAAAARYGPGGDFWRAPESRQTTGEEDPGTTGCPVPILCPPPPPPPPPPLPPVPPDEPPCGCTVARPITTWQIWNEQNSFKYFAPKPKIRLYADILRRAGNAIHGVDPAADVVVGGMWGPGSARKVVTPVKVYLKGLYRVRGIKRSFDSIAIHPYADGAVDSIRQLESARRAVKRARDPGAGLWVSEIGWAAGGPRKNPYVKGRKGQARVLTRALSGYAEQRRSLKLRGVFWYSWRDLKGGEEICDWCGNAGLRAKSGREKPAWRAFVRLARG
jgi:hypothetical protein